MVWLTLLRSRITLVLLAIGAFFAREKWREGQIKKDERIAALLKDKEDAQAVRDRVRDARNEPVQPDELKYRD